MAGPRTVSQTEGLRARRWDALILGSGVAALVAAARLGMAGHRVLLVEEDRAKICFPGLREPFFLAGAHDRGALDCCLRELTIPLIDRRRIQSHELALQLVGPELRLDVGQPALTAHELLVWDVAKPDEARGLVRALADAAEAERRAMLEAPLVRVGRRIARGRPGLQGSHVRGLPAEAANPTPATGAFLDALVRALSNLAEARPSPEARARLLGSPLSGGADLSGEAPWLTGLLRRRAEAVHVEIRDVSGPLEIVQCGGEPGILTASGQLWLGRALVLGAADSALAGAIEPDRRPDFLELQRTAARRLALHLRCKSVAIPEGMAERVVLLPDPDQPDALGLVTLAIYRSMRERETVDVIARTLLPVGALAGNNIDAAIWEDRIEHRVRRFLPFAAQKLARRKLLRPYWDDDDRLEDPPPGKGWPAEVDLRVIGRPPVYRLDRAGVAGLGFEGDLLLGWRGGDAIAAEL